jgi:hypothetical protein
VATADDNDVVFRIHVTQVLACGRKLTVCVTSRLMRIG